MVCGGPPIPAISEPPLRDVTVTQNVPIPTVQNVPTVTQTVTQNVQNVTQNVPPLRDVTLAQNVPIPTFHRPSPLPESNIAAMEADIQRVSYDFVSHTLEPFNVDDANIKHIADQLARHYGGPFGMTQIVTEQGKGAAFSWFSNALCVPPFLASALANGIDSKLHEHRSQKAVEEIAIRCILMGEYRDPNTNVVNVRPYRADIVRCMNKTGLRSIRNVTGCTAFDDYVGSDKKVGKWQKYAIVVVYKEDTGKKILSRKLTKQQPTRTATDGNSVPALPRFKMSGGKRFRLRVQRKSIRARMNEMQESGDTDLLGEFRLTLGSWLVNGFNLDRYEAIAK